MATTFTLAADDVVEARRLYDDNAPIAKICERFGMNAAQFLDYRKANGWPLRLPVATPSKRRRKAPRPSAKRKQAGPNSGKFVARLEAAIDREFARAEMALEANAPKRAEASARILASLVKTLAEFKRMPREKSRKDEHDGANAFDQPPRELAELRAELARRLDRMARDEQAE